MLQALSDKDEYVTRLKSYVELLTTVVTEQAPALLEEINLRTDKVFFLFFSDVGYNF